MPDNTSSPCDGGRDGALNAALISALLSRSQGTAGTEKPDISQPIRFSRVFFFPTKKKKKLHLLLLFFFCSLCEQRRFACTLSVQFSYKNTICRVEVIQISSQICKIKVMIFSSLLYQFGERQFLSEYMWHHISLDISTHAK